MLYHTECWAVKFHLDHNPSFAKMRLLKAHRERIKKECSRKEVEKIKESQLSWFFSNMRKPLEAQIVKSDQMEDGPIIRQSNTSKNLGETIKKDRSKQSFERLGF